MPRSAPFEGTLRRSLTFRDLLVYGLLFIAPMAPVGIFGALDARSGGAVALVYLVATVAMGLTALSYARMVRVVPRAGSVYAYARAGLGRPAGFAAGWMASLDYLLIPAVAYLFCGFAMAELVPGVDRWVWTLLAVLVTGALNLSGVRAAATVGFAVLALEIAVLLVFVAAAAVVLVREGPARGWLTPFTGDAGFSAVAVLGAVSVAVLSYLGFDAIANFAEESVGGPGRVGRAVLTCLVVAGTLFVLQTYLAAVLTPVASAEVGPEAEGTLFYDTARAAVGGWLQTAVAASKAVGAAFAALAGQAAGARLLFAMGRDRRLPGWLAVVHPRTGVPWRALLVSAVVTLVAAVWAARAVNGLDRLVSLVNVGALTAFALLHLSVVGYFAVRRRGGSAVRPVAHVALPLAGFAVVVAVVVTASGEARALGAAWLVLGAVVWAVGERRARRREGGRAPDGVGGGR
ncbi:APC family permease [Streptomyces sp. TRM 70351]|uniref:APC family permease n=1 Tax=Streptomyces sp. TRM 70351 TaxID=3116552 RepID=UPI002E7B968A|nr:APC family permease [Streptomyces sp. TRM 70351]MEE1927765.1 APC family permease [Streptomyces sp. TRM 70351]